MLFLRIKVRRKLRKLLGTTPRMDEKTKSVVKELPWLADFIPLGRRARSVRKIVKRITDETVKDNGYVGIDDDSDDADYIVYFVTARGKVLHKIEASQRHLRWENILEPMVRLRYVGYVITYERRFGAVQLRVFKVPRDIDFRQFALNYMSIWEQQDRRRRIQMTIERASDLQRHTTEVNEILND